MVHFPDGLPPVLPITIAQVRRRLPEGTEVVLGAGNRVAPGDIVARPPAAAPLVAGIRGYIAGVRPGREMLIETGAAVVRCPLGLGGEAYGMLRLIGERDQIERGVGRRAQCRRDRGRWIGDGRRATEGT